MARVALYVRLEAKPGREKELEKVLRQGLEMVMGEPDTTAWSAIRMNETTFGIFDVFPTDVGRQSHLAGRFATLLMSRKDELLREPPRIEKIDVLESKLPGVPAHA